MTLHFPTLSNLWAFRLAINAGFFEMNPTRLILSCECSEEDVALAIEKYEGSIVDVKNATAH